MLCPHASPPPAAVGHTIADCHPHPVLRSATALTLAAAAGLHLAALPSHAREGTGTAVFFAATAVLQLVAAVLVSNGAGPRARRAIIVGNAALIGLWLVSRTAGLPLGPHAGVAEPVSWLDALAVAAEVAAIVGVVVLGRRSTGAGAPVRRVPVLVVAALLVGGAGTAWAEPSHPHKSAGVTPHDHTEAEHEHHGSSRAPTPLPVAQAENTRPDHHHDGGDHHHDHP